MKAASAAFSAVLSQRSNVNIVCLLHEDFATELPVFGPVPALQGAAAGVGGGEGGEHMHVLMVLGTVRDMTRAEQVALVNVCAMRRLPLVGCNLGRAPEFTSKIIHAINCHALNGRLRGAIGSLPPFRDAASLTKLAPAHRPVHKASGAGGGAVGQRGRSEEVVDGGVGKGGDYVEGGGYRQKRGREEYEVGLVLPCVCVHTHTHTHTYTHVCIYTHTQTHTCIHTHDAYIRTYVYTYVYTYIHAYLTYVHACIHTYIHPHTHTRTHAHTHTHTHKRCRRSGAGSEKKSLSCERKRKRWRLRIGAGVVVVAGREEKAQGTREWGVCTWYWECRLSWVISPQMSRDETTSTSSAR
jgi:hypothetical protein